MKQGEDGLRNEWDRFTLKLSQTVEPHVRIFSGKAGVFGPFLRFFFVFVRIGITLGKRNQEIRAGGFPKPWEGSSGCLGAFRKVRRASEGAVKVQPGAEWTLKICEGKTDKRADIRHTT